MKPRLVKPNKPDQYRALFTQRAQQVLSVRPRRDEYVFPTIETLGGRKLIGKPGELYEIPSGAFSFVQDDGFHNGTGNSGHWLFTPYNQQAAAIAERHGTDYSNQPKPTTHIAPEKIELPQRKFQGREKETVGKKKNKKRKGRGAPVDLDDRIGAEEETILSRNGSIRGVSVV